MPEVLDEVDEQQQSAPADDLGFKPEATDDLGFKPAKTAPKAAPAPPSTATATPVGPADNRSFPEGQLSAHEPTLLEQTRAAFANSAIGRAVTSTMPKVAEGLGITPTATEANPDAAAQAHQLIAPEYLAPGLETGVYLRKSDQPTQEATPGQRRATGALKAIGGLTSDKTMATMAGAAIAAGATAGVVNPASAALLSRLMAGGFTLDMLHGLYQQHKEYRDAIDSGNLDKAQEIQGEMGVNGVMTLLTGAHALGFTPKVTQTEGDYGAKGVRVGYDKNAVDVGFRPAYRQPSPEGGYGEGSQIVPGKVSAGVTIGGKRFGTSDVPPAAPAPAEPVSPKKLGAGAETEKPVQTQPPATPPEITPEAHAAATETAQHPDMRPAMEQATNEHQPVGAEDPDSKRTITQPTDNPAINQALATSAMPEFKADVKDALKGIPGATLAATRNTKNPERLAEKINGEGQPAATVNDYGAVQIKVDSPEARDATVAALKEKYPIAKEDDNFEKGDKDYGYRNHSLQVQMPSGGTMEVQIVPKEVFDVNADEHGNYKAAREAELAGNDAEALRQKTEAKAKNDKAMEAFDERNKNLSQESGDKKPETKYEFGSTQSNIPHESEAGKALATARGLIDEKDLQPTGYGGNKKGLEPDPHVTVRYGIQGDDTAAIEKYLRSQSPFEATLGKLSAFPPKEGTDNGAVIKADVESPELRRMNAEIEQHGDFKKSDFPDYKPHATVAYVKPEAAEKYVGKDVTAGKTFPVKSVFISDRNGELKEIPLEGGKSEPKGELTRAPEQGAGGGKEATPAPKYEIAKGAAVTLADGTKGTVQWAMGDKVRVKTEDGGRRDVSRKDVKAADTSGGKVVSGVTAGTPGHEKPKSGAIAVDLDNTIAEYNGYKGPTVIGKPIEAEVAKVKKLLADGEDVWIYTARVSDPEAEPAIKAWTKEHLGKELPITNIKYPEFARFIDDRAETPAHVTEGKNAVSERGTEGVLQREPEEAGEAGRERGRVEPGKQGEEVTRAGELEAQPERSPAKVEGKELQPGEVGRMKLVDLHVDPKRFQYKLNTDATGTSGKLKDVKWNDALSGIVTVWHDPADGLDYVINGHHRYDLAERHGVDDLAVRMLPANVKTAAEARIVGAMQNIAEGNGTAIDAAKFMRDTGYTPAELDKYGISTSGAVAEGGSALARLDQKLFDDVVAGRIPERRGIAIGNAAETPAQQEALVNLIRRAENKGRTVTNATIEELGRMVRGANEVTTTTQSLFGAEQRTQNTALEKAEVSAYLRNQLAQEKKLFGGLTNAAKAEKLGEVGVNKIDTKENKEVATRAEQAQEVYDRLSTRSGPVDDILNAAAKRLAEGENAATVKSEAYRQLRTAVSEALRSGPGTAGQGGKEDLAGPEAEETKPTKAELEDAGQNSMFARRKPKGIESLALPGMEGVDAEQAQAAKDLTESQQKELVETALATPTDISKAAGEMERESPLFYGTGAGGNQTLFSMAKKTADTPAFKKWFGDSKVVDKDGKPLVVFHGTTHDFDTFDTSRGNLENDFGAAYYFSNNPKDVGANYAGEGPDLTSRIERLSERLENDDELEPEEAKRQARERLVGHGGAMMPVYLKMENPLELGGKSEPWWTIDYDEDTGEESGDLLKLHDAFLDAADEMDIRPEAERAWQKLMEDGDMELRANDAIEKLKSSEELTDAYHESGDLPGHEVVRRAIEKMGYDGIIDRTVNKKFGTERKPGKPLAGVDKDTVHYIAFQPTQIKSAIGNRGTFDPSKSNILFSKREPDPGPIWHLKSEKLIDQKMRGPMTGDQVLRMLENGGIKADELKWTGLPDFLKGKFRVTPAEVKQHIADYGIKVTETFKGNEPDAVERQREKITAMSDELRQWTEAEGLPYESADELALNPQLIPRQERWIADYQRRWDRMMEGSDRLDEPKYQHYVLPGGENYRELLLQSDTRNLLIDKPDLTPAERREMTELGYEDRQRPLNPQEEKRYKELVEKQRAFTKSVADSGFAPHFKSGHWDEPNILAHVRFNDRTTPEGKRLLHVEEIQSDWHQKGRSKGYQTDRSQEPMVATRNPGYWEVHTEGGEFITNIQDWQHPDIKTPEQAVAEAKRRLTEAPQRVRSSEKVPDAPFKKDWHEMAFRRAVRYAAEHGYDGVSWTPGDKQAERYDLSKQVDEVFYNKSRRTLMAYKDKQAVLTKTVDEADLPDYIGKETARKLLTEGKEPPSTVRGAEDQETYRLKGESLKIGGEGMKGFYDKIIPDYARKFGKQWGAKVGETNIGVQAPAWRVVNDADLGGYKIRGPNGESPERDMRYRTGQLEAANKYADEMNAKSSPTGLFPYLDITPEMRKSAVEQGLPLFKKGWGVPMRRAKDEFGEAANRDITANAKGAKAAVVKSDTGSHAVLNADAWAMLAKGLGVDNWAGIAIPKEDIAGVTDWLKKYGAAPLAQSLDEAAAGGSVAIIRHDASPRDLAEEKYHAWQFDHGGLSDPVINALTVNADEASADEVKGLRREARDLKECVADLTLENRLLKKSMIADGEDIE